MTRTAQAAAIGVALVTGLGVLSLVLEGAPITWALLWLIVPVVLVWYLLSPAGRQGFRPESPATPERWQCQGAAVRAPVRIGKNVRVWFSPVSRDAQYFFHV